MKRGFLFSSCAMLVLAMGLACGGGEEASSDLPNDEVTGDKAGKGKGKGKGAKGGKGGKQKSKHKSKGKGKGKAKGKAGKKPSNDLICCRDSNNPYIYYYAWMDRRDCNRSVYDYEVVPDRECHAAAD